MQCFLGIPNISILYNYNATSKPKIDIGTIHSAYSDFTSYTCIHLCLSMCMGGCLALYNFITCIALCNHHNNEDIEYFHYHKDLSCCHTYPPHSPIP